MGEEVVEVEEKTRGGVRGRVGEKKKRETEKTCKKKKN